MALDKINVEGRGLWEEGIKLRLKYIPKMNATLVAASVFSFIGGIVLTFFNSDHLAALLNDLFSTEYLAYVWPLSDRIGYTIKSCFIMTLLLLLFFLPVITLLVLKPPKVSQYLKFLKFAVVGMAAIPVLVFIFIKIGHNYFFPIDANFVIVAAKTAFILALLAYLFLINYMISLFGLSKYYRTIYSRVLIFFMITTVLWPLWLSALFLYLLVGVYPLIKINNYRHSLIGQLNNP